MKFKTILSRDTAQRSRTVLHINALCTSISSLNKIVSLYIRVGNSICQGYLLLGQLISCQRKIQISKSNCCYFSNLLLFSETPSMEIYTIPPKDQSSDLSAVTKKIIHSYRLEMH